MSGREVIDTLSEDQSASWVELTEFCGDVTWNTRELQGYYNYLANWHTTSHTLCLSLCVHCNGKIRNSIVN